MRNLVGFMAKLCNKKQLHIASENFQARFIIQPPETLDNIQGLLKDFS